MIVKLYPRRRLRGLGSVMPLALAYPPGTGNVLTAPDATSCSYWDYFFNPESWKSCVLAAASAQDAATVQNAQNFYGPSIAAVAQAAVDKQSQSTPAQVQNIMDTYGAGAIDVFGNRISTDPSKWPVAAVPWWVWAIGIGAGGLALLNFTRR